MFALPFSCISAEVASADMQPRAMHMLLLTVSSLCSCHTRPCTLSFKAFEKHCMLWHYTRGAQDYLEWSCWKELCRSQMLVQVLGSRKGPLECIIGATAVGPTLHFGADIANPSTKAEIAFGSVEVLQVWKSPCLQPLHVQRCLAYQHNS